jgi:hypothetical protein
MKTKLLKLCRRFLPFIFLKKVWFDSHQIYIPRWGWTDKEIEDAKSYADKMSSIFKD